MSSDATYRPSRLRAGGIALALLLVPWAAAGPISHSPTPNDVFRLLVDDAVAGCSVQCFVEQAALGQDDDIMATCDDSGHSVLERP